MTTTDFLNRKAGEYMYKWIWELRHIVEEAVEDGYAVKRVLVAPKIIEAIKREAREHIIRHKDGSYTINTVPVRVEVATSGKEALPAALGISLELYKQDEPTGRGYTPPRNPDDPDIIGIDERGVPILA